MRVLVIGAGVLGCNIAANFYRAGKDVTLLARGDWYKEIKENGLRIKNKFTIKTKTYPVNVISELAEEDVYDAIFVSLRFTQLNSIFDVLNKNKSKNIIFNGNDTMTDEVVNNLPGKNVMFSFSLSAGAREEKRVNSIDLKKITIGDVNGKNNELFIRELLCGTDYKIVYQPNMKDYLLCHAAFVVPVSFACYYTDGDLRKIKHNKEYLTNVVRANIECYEALENLGVEILPSEDKEYKTEKWFRSVMRFYKLMCGTSLGKLCASDHAMNAKDEMHALALSIKEIIDKAGTGSYYFDELWKPLLHEIKTK